VSRLRNDLRYFVRTSLRGLRASPVPTVISALTIAVALVLSGAFVLLLQNMEGLLDRVGDEMQVTAYLQEGLDPGERESLAARVRTVEGVAEVTLVSEAEALERFRSGVGAGSELLEALEHNPLPASLEIRLAPHRRHAEGLRVVVQALDGLPGIAELAYGQEWVEGYARFVGLVRGAGMGAGVLLGLATLLIVANTIRLAVYARRDELEILSLVGASRPFVATPFLLEGALLGTAGGLLALCVLFGLYRFALPGIESGLQLFLGFAAPSFFSATGSAGLVGAGALLGLLGSAAALVRGWGT